MSDVKNTLKTFEAGSNNTIGGGKVPYLAESNSVNSLNI